ncbi:hypothetical protein KB20921_07190 [Edwardsiella ictaluri]|nr:hypothetical protein KH20906_07180 [Edwardsiella ictaluri]BEI01458.1 hypothetical protein KB20921_07190 [Edwardsiella ictaluri]BEI04931.1 hypothetical protein KH201010_07170 [Edwardsiella ictaluri]BEI08386.1 hypothetical protein STU22726_07170 [Edwardsiella ictaluri]BEI11868.1 hypothetical protein STU22816_07210 [Edwardsiella ictaluri]
MTGVVCFFRHYGVSIEAALGRLVGEEETLNDPAVVQSVERTGIDPLAVAIGSAHGLYLGTPHLDFAQASVAIPRV